MAANDLAGFALKVAGFAEGLPADMERATAASALKMTTQVRAAIAAGSGGDSRLSGMGGKAAKAKGGGKVGAAYDVKPASGGRAASALVRGTGPLWILDNPTKRHKIQALPKKGRSSKSKAGYAQREAFYNAIFGGDGGFAGVSPMPVAAGVFRFRADHPGTRGKRTFWRTVDRLTPQVGGWYDRELVKAMGRRFK